MSNFFDRGYCPACDGETEQVWTNYAPGRYLVRCENCGREVSEEQHEKEETAHRERKQESCRTVLLPVQSFSPVPHRITKLLPVLVLLFCSCSAPLGVDYGPDSCERRLAVCEIGLAMCKGEI